MTSHPIVRSALQTIAYWQLSTPYATSTVSRPHLCPRRNGPASMAKKTRPSDRRRVSNRPMAQAKSNARTNNPCCSRPHSTGQAYLLTWFVPSIANLHLQPTVSGSTARGSGFAPLGPTPVYLLRKRLITRFGDDVVCSTCVPRHSGCYVQDCLTAKVVSRAAPT